MGHTKEKFETMMMTLACGSQGPGISGDTKRAPELKTLSGQPKDPNPPRSPLFKAVKSYRSPGPGQDRDPLLRVRP